MRRTVAAILVLAAALSPSRAIAAGAPTPKGPQATRPALSPAERARRAHRIIRFTHDALDQFKAGRYDHAKTLLEKILEIDPDNSLAHYNLACVYSRQNKPDRAIGALHTALDHGYTAFRHLERDPDLKPLRNLPGYKAVLARKNQIQRARADKILAALKKQFGDGFICEIDHESKLVFATDIDARTLGELKGSLSRYARAQWKTLFEHGFDQYVTVVIPRDATNLPRGIGGIYNPQLRQLTARSIGMVLTHEFTHALHFADQEARGQQHPIWIAEGLATLFESSDLADGRITPIPNRRGNAVKYLVQRKRNIPWERFFKLSHGEFMNTAVSAYPQGRYIMMYLHRKGLLRKWYDAYTASYEKDKTGAKAIEKVFAKPLARIEADWLAWVPTVKSVPRQLAARQPYIGVQLARQFDGLRIVRVVRGSAADKAGLKAQDVLIKIDGRRMVEIGELLRTVSAHKVGDKVTIEFRRGTGYKTVTATLGAVPTRLVPPPRSEPKPKPKPETKPETRPAKKKAA